MPINLKLKKENPIKIDLNQEKPIDNSESPQIQYEKAKKEILEIRTKLLNEKDLPLDKRKGITYEAPIDLLCTYPGLERPYTEGYIENLAQDIDKLGVIQQPTCTLEFRDNILSLADQKSAFYINALIYIVCGNGRVEANKLLKKSFVTVTIKYMTQDEIFSVAVSENEKRENPNPIDLARQLQNWIDSTGITQAKIAEKLDKTQPWVSQHLRLLKAPSKVQELIRERTVSLNQANKIFQLEEKEAQISLAELCAEGITDMQLNAAFEKKKLKLIVETGLKAPLTAESKTTSMTTTNPLIRPKMEESRLNQLQIIVKFLIDSFVPAIKSADESSAANPLFGSTLKKMYTILKYCSGNCNACENIVRCRGLEELK